MKTILSIVLFFLPLLYIDIGEELVNALKQGHYEIIFKYLDEKTIVRILDKENLLSKEQCSANLSLFFEKNPIKGFNLIQNTPLSTSAQFLYGIIDTGSNKYKLSILIKKSVIVQIRIDYFE